MIHRLRSISQHMIRSERLLLTPLVIADAPRVRALAGAVEIARNALHIPHPFEDGVAEAWIGSIDPEARVFAIRLAAAEPLIGIAGLVRDRDTSVAELSYWIGVPYWGNGYATEAARAVLAYGFDVLGLSRIYATSLGRNDGSRRVLDKIGMKHEGCLRQHVLHWGRYEDLNYYGLLRSEYEACRDR